MVRKPHFNSHETVVCVLRGSEKFRMVSAIFKQNIYSGIYEDLDPLETPINFFEKDPNEIARFRMMKISNVYEATVQAGQCLYIPSYYWYQSETQAIVDPKLGSPESMFLSF